MDLPHWPYALFPMVKTVNKYLKGRYTAVIFNTKVKDAIQSLIIFHELTSKNEQNRLMGLCFFYMNLHKPPSFSITKTEWARPHAMVTTLHSSGCFNGSLSLAGSINKSRILPETKYRWNWWNTSSCSLTEKLSTLSDLKINMAEVVKCIYFFIIVIRRGYEVSFLSGAFAFPDSSQGFITLHCSTC